MQSQQEQQQSSFVARAKETGDRHLFPVLAIQMAVGWSFTEIVHGEVEQDGASRNIATYVTAASITGLCE